MYAASCSIVQLIFHNMQLDAARLQGSKDDLVGESTVADQKGGFYLRGEHRSTKSVQVGIDEQKWLENLVNLIDDPKNLLKTY